MKKPANLQLTVKHAARLMNVSERSIDTARRIARLRPDLVAKVEAGEMSIHEADLIATGKTKPTPWDRLVAAWNNATDENRNRLALSILTAAERPAGFHDGSRQSQLPASRFGLMNESGDRGP